MQKDSGECVCKLCRTLKAFSLGIRQDKKSQNFPREKQQNLLLGQENSPLNRKTQILLVYSKVMGPGKQDNGNVTRC